MTQPCASTEVTLPQNLIDHFQKGRLLAAGVQGRVYKAIDINTQQPRAMKRPMHQNADGTYPVDEFLKQKDKNHPNILHVFDVVFDSSNRPYILMELCPGGDLFDASREHPAKTQTWVAGVTMQVLRGMEYLHRNFQEAHNDLKPENILLDRKPTHAHDIPCVKISDFGCASAQGASADEFGGDPRYRAPETFHDEPLSAASDLWALGVTLFELLSGGKLMYVLKDNIKGWVAFCRHAGGQLCQSYMEALQDKTPVDVSLVPGTQAKDFLQQLLNLNPAARISARDAINHAWFQEPRQTQAIGIAAQSAPLTPATLQTYNQLQPTGKRKFIVHAVCWNAFNFLRVRASPSLDGNVKYKILKNDFKNVEVDVDVDASTKDWYKVESVTCLDGSCLGGEGWMVKATGRTPLPTLCPKP